MKANYIETRLNGQMEYYHKKCTSLRNEYYGLSGISIVINAFIPVLSIGIESTGWLKYIVAILSATTSVLTSLLLLRKTKETWIRYRSTYEQLKHEKILFETSSGKYATANEQEFIVACEAIMMSEHTAWKELLNDTKDKKE